MECLKIALIVLVLICCRSDGSSLGNFRFLAGIDRNSDGNNQVSPSPSPEPAANLDSAPAENPANRTKEENCDDVINKCDIKDYGITACVPSVGNGSQAAYLLALSSASSSHELNIVVHPANITLKNITISGQEVKKVNLPSLVEGDSSITVSIRKETCEIQIGALIPQGVYSAYMTPTYGAYMLFAAAVCTGGIWACCKLVKRKRHLDGGIAYKELEMGQQEADPSFVIESPEGWDENWDDEWEDEKAVRSPGARKSLQHGASLKYIDTSQWGTDWDD